MSCLGRLYKDFLVKAIVCSAKFYQTFAKHHSLILTFFILERLSSLKVYKKFLERRMQDVFRTKSAKLHALHPHVLTCLVCWCSQVSTCLECLCAHVPCVLMCSNAKVSWVLTCLCANMLCMLMCLHANVP